MADPKVPIDLPKAGTAPAAPKARMPEGNPALRMMGLPRIRARLPSRNWLIFLSITGSFFGALSYDRYQKRRIQQKWCNAVSHLANVPVTTQTLPRKITVFLAAPPGDGVLVAREYFREYVKPLLVAAALDWDVVEGRREGDVRAKLAERLRKKRREKGEAVRRADGEEEEVDYVMVQRERGGVTGSGEVGGDLVIGRHTWKEYIRGLHEGWLGPMDPPEVEIMKPEVDEPSGPAKSLANSLLVGDTTTPVGRDVAPLASPPSSDLQPDTTEILLAGSDTPSSTEPTPDVSEPSVPATEEPPKEEEKPKAKPVAAPPYILPPAYPAAHLSPSAPQTFDPSLPLPFPHLLGFFNTPLRVYRYLTRRSLADSTGAAVVALILARDGHVRAFREGQSSVLEQSDGSSVHSSVDNYGEIASALRLEEDEWHKSARAPNEEGVDKERPWQEAMVVDARVGGRMRTVETSVERPEGGLVGDLVADATAGETAGVSGGDGSVHELRPRSKEWKGGADRRDRLDWLTWAKRTTGWEDEALSNRIKGWEQGNVGSDSE